MLSSEAIIIPAPDYRTYFAMIKSVSKYAIISVSFTYDRLESANIISRIKNIIKGKIAENLFYHFCQSKELSINTEECVTPFWMADHRDFLWLGGEWDIKNNFIYCSDSEFRSIDISHFPALVPNKNTYDQWAKKNTLYFSTSKYTAYLFSFMRLNPTSSDFFKLSINEAQLNYISEFSKKIRYQPTTQLYQAEKDFFNTIYSLNPNPMIEVIYQPDLIITVCANPRYWAFFQNTSVIFNNTSFDVPSLQDPWYVVKNEKLSFLGGKLTTKIQNMTCSLSLLPSFKQVAKL